MQYVEKIHVTADARTLKNRNLYIPANGARSQFMKVTSIWILQKARFVKIASADTMKEAVKQVLKKEGVWK